MAKSELLAFIVSFQTVHYRAMPLIDFSKELNNASFQVRSFSQI